VHLVRELPPTVPWAGLMQKPKGRSSRRLRAGFPQLRRRPARWSVVVRRHRGRSATRRGAPLRRQPAAGRV